MTADVREWARRWEGAGMTLPQFRAWLCNKTEKGWTPLMFPESMFPAILKR